MNNYRNRQFRRVLIPDDKLNAEAQTLANKAAKECKIGDHTSGNNGLVFKTCDSKPPGTEIVFGGNYDKSMMLGDFTKMGVGLKKFPCGDCKSAPSGLRATVVVMFSK